ncbi:unnamed protein product, partial [marine sediment metagenome]
MSKLAVLAIGGNSLIKDKQHETVEDQYDAVCETAKHVAGMIEQGYDVVVTHGNGPQVVVDKTDPAFQNPAKPIGTFYTKERAEELQKEHPDWVIIDDVGRGYRRVVPSPMPVEIVEQDAIEMLVKNNFSVVG